MLPHTNTMTSSKQRLNMMLHPAVMPFVGADTTMLPTCKTNQCQTWKSGFAASAAGIYI
jgi:hypothetical protein